MKSVMGLALLALLLGACAPDRGEGADAAELPTQAVAGAQPAPGERWYSQQQLRSGQAVFARHCAVCHGAQAQGTVPDWRQRLDDGSFPPPPLNGSAHAWHHPRSVLLQVINDGGVALGGKMPGFADILSDAEKLAAIAYFQSFWSEEIYANWLQMGGNN